LKRNTNSLPTATRCLFYNLANLDFLPEKSLIIVAGGTGTRMNSEIPKQFLSVAGIPVIIHTINTFLKYDNGIDLVIALPENYFSYWKELCEKFSFSINHRLSKGGETRFHSVKSALSFVSDDRIVAIHDAVRPFVNIETIEKGFRNALTFGNAIPVVPLTESARWIEGRTNRPVDREHIRIVQTPQVFDAGLIKRAYYRVSGNNFTDDASVLEAMGEALYLYDGNPENIKITRPFELSIAEALLKG